MRFSTLVFNEGQQQPISKYRRLDLPILLLSCSQGLSSLWKFYFFWKFLVFFFYEKCKESVMLKFTHLNISSSHHLMWNLFKQFIWSALLIVSVVNIWHLGEQFLLLFFFLLDVKKVTNPFINIFKSMA